MGDRIVQQGVQKDILSLPAGIQARYIHLTQRILLVDPNLGMPHSSPLGDGLFELLLFLTLTEPVVPDYFDTLI